MTEIEQVVMGGADLPSPEIAESALRALEALEGRIPSHDPKEDGNPTVV